MDLSNLPFLSKLSILQKLRYNSLIRLRKTTKYYDNFVEKHRQKIAIKPEKLDFQIEIVLDSIGNRAKVRFSVSGQYGDDVIIDPYKQLSALAFNLFFVHNEIGRDSLGGIELETCFQETVFPLLKKMKPLCNRLGIAEFTTEVTLKVAQFVNSYNFTTEWGPESRTDFDTKEIVGNEIVQRSPVLSLGLNFSEFSFYHIDVLKKCTVFHNLELYYEQPAVLKVLIQNLCKLSDFGNLKQIEITGAGDIYEDSPNEKPDGIDLLYDNNISPNERRDNDCRAVYLFNGASKWLIGKVSKDTSWPTTTLCIYLIDKNPSHLLDLLVKLTLNQEDEEIDASSIREKFVSATSMTERYDIFKAFRERMKKRQKFGSLSILKLSCCTLL